MSMQPRCTEEVPEDTRRVAQAAFPHGNVYLRLRDEVGTLYNDALFADLFPERGQPAEAPGRLALITVMQFAEGLSDRQAANAVRARIDWKYALGLELDDPGFDYSVLSEFRGRLLASQKAQALLDVLLQELKQRGLLKTRGQQRTDSTHVLAAVRQLSRLEFIGETMRRALNELAAVQPQWLPTVIPGDWYPRYAQRFDNMRLPRERGARERLIETIGVDGQQLLSRIYALDAPERDVLRLLPGVEMLRRVWLQQFWTDNHGDGTSHIRLRTEENEPPCESRIHSPYDEDARYSVKRKTAWVGYKAHMTETCEDDQVNLVTHVETTTAIEQDVAMPGTIHAALADKDLLPSVHFLDAGYISADLLVAAERDLDIAICGPAKKDVRWQANTGEGFGLASFKIDWVHQTVTCPNGQTATAWRDYHTPYGKPAIQVKFKTSTCRACADQEKCTRSRRGARSLVLLPQAQHEALQQVRQRQGTADFRRQYAKRSGIEGTISQAVRSCDLRRARYRGLAKTHLQMIATAVAVNLQRLFDWWTDVPRSMTRISPFAQLAPESALSSTCWRAC